MQSRTVVGLMIGLCLVGCSGTDSSGADGAGSIPGSGGATGTTTTQTATGGSLSSPSAGGASAQGGTGLSRATSSGAAGGLESCPNWPAAKLLPLVGPMFYGPDPGPCVTETYSTLNSKLPIESVTFTYDSQGAVMSAYDEVDRDVTTYTWSNGVLVSYASVTPNPAVGTGEYSETYEYGPGFVAATPAAASNGNPTRYTLTANGYPLTRVTTNKVTGDVQNTLTYEYEGCRLKRRRATDANGATMPSGDITYEYDDAGHVVRRVAADGTNDNYDYRCWSK